jgi:hypothetical protein
MKVFLGGTVNGSKWRNIVKERLSIDYFDPVVDEWDNAAYERELSERRYCDYVLYVLTPKMTGYYAVSEVVDDSYKRPDRTIYCFLSEDGEEKMAPALIDDFNDLGETVSRNGGMWLANLDEVISFLNSASSTELVKDNCFFNAFICYGKQESERFAINIGNRLNDLGHSVFIDLNEIPIIIESEEYIYSKILRSDNFIYIISPNSVRSEYCKRELDFAIKFNKRIIPILHHELGNDNRLLDDIIAKKQIIDIKINNSDEQVSDLIKQVSGVINFDSKYVRRHTDYLFKARNWHFGGCLEADLLYGEDRKQAIEWLKNKSNSLSTLQIQINYIEACKRLSVFMIPLLSLNKRMTWLIHLKGFDQVAMLLSLLGPIAMMDQVQTLLCSEDSGRYLAISLPMWVLFSIINSSLILVSIKTKDLRLFISQVVSLVVSITIILIVLFKL